MYWKCIKMFGNGLKFMEIYVWPVGLSFWSGVTRFPGLVVNDMMMMDLIGWPYDSFDCLLYWYIELQ